MPRPSQGRLNEAGTADDLEWKLIYVGSSKDEKYDRVLESVIVSPVNNVGIYSFIFQADPPKAALIPEDDILGVTVLLLTPSYMGQEFIRVGYYMRNNEYADDELCEQPPAELFIDRVQRNILSDKPQITKFPIVFSSTPPLNSQTTDCGSHVHTSPGSLIRNPTVEELEEGVTAMELHGNK